MCIAVIGGMDRLHSHYHQEARHHGIKLRIFGQAEVNLGTKLKNVDALLIFTNKVSHRAKNEALLAVKERAIPVFMEHSCGVCTLRGCLKCLSKEITGLPPTP
ncbi:DUF2325 domain-containing protein [Trichloromonas sp.]|uniref:DUF2325 domain-containing protein n=1 Tax=Trichloromonas sp. TaxID=3069249 RepID=UPI002A44706D|nr:DUF2325 domain-containing protein [Trichloromonas sp.]